jgi:Flp pilus assembly pilin Flp
MPYDRRIVNVRSPLRRSSQCGACAGDDTGQSLAEYALIVALIVIVALVALTLFGTQINDILSMIADQING